MNVVEGHGLLEMESPALLRSRLDINNGFSYDLEDIHVRPRPSSYQNFKSIVERIIAGLFLVVLSPIIVVFALVIRLTSKGPAFYIQERLGLNGKSYRMIKLRTMVHDAEAGTGAVWAKAKDPRVTRLGSFMRKTQIDEFPQLINVILGQMSLIGPRPERPEIADRLELEIPYYKQRLYVKPGITGLAQLSLPADTDIESVRRKLVPDLYYVRHMSLKLDLIILVHTALYFVYSLSRYSLTILPLPTVQSARESLTAEFSRDYSVVESE